MCISVESGEKNIETELNINVSYFIQDFQSSNCRILIFSGVSGSIVAVLALAVLYECAKGLHVYLRSRLQNQNKRTNMTKRRIYR